MCCRVPFAVNAAQISFISGVEEGSSIRLGEGRTVKVAEPLGEIIGRLNKANRLPEG